MNATDSRLAAGWLALALLAVVWGYNWVTVKIALAHSNAWDLVALRVAAGTVILFVVLAARGVDLRPRRVAETMILGLLQTTGFLGVVTLAMVAGDAGKTAILTFTMPFWTLALAWICLGERLGPGQWRAVLLVLAGLLLLLEPWSLSSLVVPKLLAVASGLLWAAATVHARAMALRAPLPILSTTAWQMLYGTPLLVLMALLHEGRPIDWNTEFIWAFAFTAIGGSALGWLLWTFVIDRLSASVASLASLANPVIALLAGWLQLGEVPSPAEGVGMACIVAALVLLSAPALLGRRRRLSTMAGLSEDALAEDALGSPEEVSTEKAKP
jgi:drug/metabolite transporter (DMT)-like permease